MAAKTTPYEVELDISDMERNYYRTHRFTLARGASETEERLMVRLIAFACQAGDGISFGEGPDEPVLWKRDPKGGVELWVEVGEPDDKRLLKACGRAKQVVVAARPWNAGCVSNRTRRSASSSATSRAARSTSGSMSAHGHTIGASGAHGSRVVMRW